MAHAIGLLFVSVILLFISRFLEHKDQEPVSIILGLTAVIGVCFASYELFIVALQIDNLLGM